MPDTIWGAENVAVTHTPAVQDLTISLGIESGGKCVELSEKEASEAEIGPCTNLLGYGREGGRKPALSLQNHSI